MTPDDPRHGTYAGCQTHWRAGEKPCEPCLTAARRYKKSVVLDHLQGRPTLHIAADFERLLEPWLALGLSRSSIAVAAGLRETGSAAWVHRPYAMVRRSTWQAVSTITEADLPDTWTLWGDLTRTRIQSLMAAGHPLTSMPVDPRGRWRDRPRISVGVARAIRDFYTDHQHDPGTSKYTRSRALAAGYQPPAAWDDPGTLAWPLGATSPLHTETDAVDDVVVARVLAGERLRCNRAEKAEVLRRAAAAGRSLNSLERQMGWNAIRDRKQVAA